MLFLPSWVWQCCLLIHLMAYFIICNKWMLYKTMDNTEKIAWSQTSQYTFTIRTLLKIWHESFYPIKAIKTFAVLRDHWTLAAISFYTSLYTKGEWESYEITGNYWQTYSEEYAILLYNICDIYRKNLFSKNSSLLSDIKVIYSFLTSLNIIKIPNRKKWIASWRNWNVKFSKKLRNKSQPYI